MGDEEQKAEEALERRIARFKTCLGEATRMRQGGGKNESAVSFWCIAAACVSEGDEKRV